MRTRTSLVQKQSLPLEAKIILTNQIIREWHSYWEGNVYVSISGGKDSLALLHIVRSLFPAVVAVFCDTGLEYPEVRKQALSTPNLIVLKPELNFKDVINKYGYPIASKETAQFVYETRTSKSEKLKQIRLHGDRWGRGKIPEKWKYLLNAPFPVSHKCCDYLKKIPFKKFEKKNGLHGIIGTTAQESSRRALNWIRYGCNAFGAKIPLSKPLSIWMEDNIWEYIKANNLQYPDIYDKGERRTGCMFCCFGVHMEQEPNRFQRMKLTHNAQWNYCINKLGLAEVLDYIGVPYE